MTDYEAAMSRALDKNIQRYTWLLGTHLTEAERGFVKRRLAEDRQALRRLRARRAEVTPTVPTSVRSLGATEVASAA